MKRLHLGCGDRILSGWENVDGRAGHGVDREVIIPGGLWVFASSTYDWIYSSHVIEHIAPDKLPEALRELHRIMLPGGRLTIATTDIEGIFWHRFRTPDNGSAWEAALFGEVGSHDDPMAAHRNCFTYPKLERLLRDAGFASVRPWSTDEYPEIHALNDYARSCALVTCFAEARKGDA
jgi:predicted SAM-dependent methyltransferase